MEDRTGEVARRLATDPRVVAVLVGAPWHPAAGGPEPDADPAEERGARGQVYVGVPSPAELRALDLPVDGLRHFGLTPAELRAGGWTDADLRSAGLTPPGAAPDPVEWFVAGEPAQLMLGLAPHGPPLLARPEPRWDGHRPVLDPADTAEVPGLLACTDPESEQGLQVTAVRDGLLRRARRRLVHCALCHVLVHRADTTHGACHGCAGRWLGIVH
ncbi:hypothetical protein SAMN05216207_1002333 [Pseudonocardia ammonioxydans]|uniref:Uncharacterized protein n=1 Tax=Pseudonocardia ammonioxydans TaxID=260086 RepID=A0A1I4TKA9_PSUAM|nr:hypothetical protein [Pseudonocardia ammonioxydans]SFM77063.1 hypothetical protein SAMN05216207_1002333 [Pseudonocardia ammonioxydans]